MDKVATQRAHVLVVEDDPRVFAHWQRLLATDAELEVASSFQSAWDRTELASWSSRPCDSVLVDVRLPDGSGIDLLDRLSELRPRPGVAVVTGFFDAQTALAVHGRCAIAVPKPADQETLRAVVLMTLTAHAQPSGIEHFARTHRLSPQETRLLLAAVRDASNDEAAHELGCSPSTVRSYWARIFTKTGTHSAREVVAKLFRFANEGTIPPASTAPPSRLRRSV